MRCQEVRKHTSEYIDHFLGDAERERYLEHLADCVACREHVEATRRAIASLKSLTAPMPPADLFDRSIIAMEREAEPAMTIVTRRHFRFVPRYEGSLLQVTGQVLQNYEFKLISYSIGLFVSFMVFTGVLLSMRPLLSIAPFDSPSTQQAIYMTSGEQRVLADARIPAVYTLPRFTTSGELLEAAKVAEIPNPDDGLVVIAEIATDGRGSILEVVSGPYDTRFVGEIASAINRPRAFIPARASSGRPVPSRIVLRFDRVDIIG